MFLDGNLGGFDFSFKFLVFYLLFECNVFESLLFPIQFVGSSLQLIPYFFAQVHKSSDLPRFIVDTIDNFAYFSLNIGEKVPDRVKDGFDFL
jgi:hypothetical protein